MNLNQIEIDALWQKYLSERLLSDKHKLLIHYIWLIKYALNNMPLPANSILDDEDFLSFGMLGLNDAFDRFDTNRGIKFESFAIKRIKGIIRDEMRKIDWLSRTTRKKAQEFSKASEKAKSEFGREASSEEIRSKLNVTEEKYKSYLQAAAAAKASFSLSETQSLFISVDNEEINILEEYPDESSDFIADIEYKERQDQITIFLSQLKENHRIVVTLYYFENLTFKEIGLVLNVSESRICQIHTQVINELKTKLSGY
jgi:RNA polymerase sigma factor for flagellar operon FliA